MARFTNGSSGGNRVEEQLPPVERDLSCKSESPPTNPDVVVDVQDTRTGEWTRFPVTAVETRMHRDGPSDRTTVARVDFPAEWDGEDILQYVSGYQSLKAGVEVGDEEIDPSTVAPEDVYDAARIFYRDNIEDEWAVDHYGYIGSLGPTTDSGVFKMWVYDIADIMTSISVSKSFGEPTTTQVLNFVLDGVDDRGEDVGIRERSVFDETQVAIYGPNAASLTAEKAEVSDAIELGFDFISTPLAFKPDQFAAEVKTILGRDEDTRGALSGQKSFKANRHNMAQLLTWFCKQVDAQWFFEPTADGPVLVFDATGDGPPRREFVDGEADETYTDGPTFGRVNVLNNNAVADIKPINTIRVNGATVRDRPIRFGDDADSPTLGYTEKYPTAKATYTPLIQRAGGYEYGPTDVNTDDKTTAEAAASAVDEMRQHLAETTDGEIELTGDPFVAPFDYLTVVPVCNDQFQFADASPITYEVNSVRHVREAGERYKTMCGVSFVFDESKVFTEATYRDA